MNGHLMHKAVVFSGFELATSGTNAYMTQYLSFLASGRFFGQDQKSCIPQVVDVSSFANLKRLDRKYNKSGHGDHERTCNLGLLTGL